MIENKILQLSEIEAKDYVDNIDFLQNQLLPNIQSLLKESKVLNSKNTIFNKNIESLKEMVKDIETLQKNSNYISESQQQYKQQFENNIKLLNLKLKELAAVFIDEFMKKTKDYAASIDIELQTNTERSKLQLSNIVRELKGLSSTISSNLEEIRSIKPNINIDEIQKTMNSTIKKSINYKKIDESIDQYVGKISYFDEKIKEYQGSAEIFNKATKNINYYGMTLTFFVGISLGCISTLIF